MATPVYSTLFIGGQGTGLGLVYAVPAGHIAVIRSVIAFFPETPGNTAAAVYCTDTATYAFYHLQLDPYEYVNETMHQVVAPGTFIDGQSSGPGVVSLRVCGYLLTEP